MKAKVPAVESNQEFHTRKLKHEVKHRMQRIRALAGAIMHTTDLDHLISRSEEIVEHANKLRSFCHAIRRLQNPPKPYDPAIPREEGMEGL